MVFIVILAITQFLKKKDLFFIKITGEKVGREEINELPKIKGIVKKKTIAEKQEEKTKQILKKMNDPDLLIDTIKEIQKEVAGEEDTIIALIIVSTTRLLKGALPESKNLFLSDKTGIGKDWVTKKTLEVIIPEENLCHVTKMSNEAFTYWHNPKFEREWTWDDKVIHFEDINQSLLNTSTFKVMSSGGSSAVVVKEQRTIEIPINGKPCMILTSHHANPEDEALRRFPIGSLNDTEEQTKKVKEKITKKYIDKKEETIDYILRSAVQSLEVSDVIIPFVEIIQDFFPNDILMRTHYQRFLNYICASAIFHQNQREKIDDGKLIATPDDYMIARMVLIYTTSNPKMIPMSKEYREVIELIQKNPEELTINELFLHPNFNHSKMWLYRNLPKLCSTGIIAKGKKYDDKSNKDVDAYYFADLNARALPTWNEIIDKIEVKTVNTVKTENTITEENHINKRFSQGMLKHVKTPLLKLFNRKVLTVFTHLSLFLRERDEKRYSKYYEDRKPEVKEKTQFALNDKLLDVKNIIELNPEDNYQLILDKYGQNFIDKGLEENIFKESILGKKLDFIGVNK